MSLGVSLKGRVEKKKERQGWRRWDLEGHHKRLSCEESACWNMGMEM